MTTGHRYTVGCDTPLGVVFLDCDVRKGGLLIVENFRDAVAKHEGFESEECEVITIVDNKRKRVMWPVEGDRG